MMFCQRQVSGVELTSNSNAQVACINALRDPPASRRNVHKLRAAPSPRSTRRIVPILLGSVSAGELPVREDSLLRSSTTIGTERAFFVLGKEGRVHEASAPRVLVVDDDAAVRSIIVETLRGEGYLLDEASDGAAGLEQLQAARPDLILLDSVMPVVDGYEFLERLRREHSTAHVPVVLISATHALPDAAHDLGVRAVLPKPFDIGILVAIVDRLTRPVKTARA